MSGCLTAHTHYKITRAVNCRVNRKKTMFFASYTLHNRFICSQDSTFSVKIKWMSSNRRLLFIFLFFASAITVFFGYYWIDEPISNAFSIICFISPIKLSWDFVNVTTVLFHSFDLIFPICSVFFGTLNENVLWMIENWACIWFTADTWMTALFDVIMEMPWKAFSFASELR